MQERQGELEHQQQLNQLELQKAKELAEIEVDKDLWKFSCSISGLCHILTVGLEQVYNRGYCLENTVEPRYNEVSRYRKKCSL